MYITSALELLLTIKWIIFFLGWGKNSLLLILMVLCPSFICVILMYMYILMCIFVSQLLPIHCTFCTCMYNIHVHTCNCVCVAAAHIYVHVPCTSMWCTCFVHRYMCIHGIIVILYKSLMYICIKRTCMDGCMCIYLYMYMYVHM